MIVAFESESAGRAVEISRAIELLFTVIQNPFSRYFYSIYRMKTYPDHLLMVTEMQVFRDAGAL